ncbi:MAG: MBL fold metallo-hydrolase [Deltaproteobacteria bacterium]|nr:MBL fold metallo-hydrolase [Deltaproteobacteria bacterium]
MKKSPQWYRGRFRNPLPMKSNLVGALFNSFSKSPYRIPSKPLPVINPDPALIGKASSTSLQVTWLGHSTLYIVINGVRILTDPVWGSRASPVSWAGPQRWYKPLISIEKLPVPDAVLISHDHYDHLDMYTIKKIKHWKTAFIVPLGVGVHLEKWGVDSRKIVELDWWEQNTVKNVVITATPARHASGRSATDRNKTLWCSFAVTGTTKRVWYSGDTGFFPEMADIGKRLGPFDLTMIETGAYSQWWPDWHSGPEQAVFAHILLRGKVFLPIHWGLFSLAYHSWTEPVERVMAITKRLKVKVLTPRPGEILKVNRKTITKRWWPQIPWVNSIKNPIHSSLLKKDVNLIRNTNK